MTQVRVMVPAQSDILMQHLSFISRFPSVTRVATCFSKELNEGVRERTTMGSVQLFFCSFYN